MCTGVEKSRFTVVSLFLDYYLLVIIITCMSFSIQTLTYFFPLLYTYISCLSIPFLYVVQTLYMILTALRQNSHSIQFTHLKYRIQWFPTIFTKLCNHRHSQFQNILTTAKRDCIHQRSLPIPLSPSTGQPLISFLSLRIDLPLLDVSYRWNHTVCGFLWQAAFTQHAVFKVHPRCPTCQHFVSFQD